MAGRPGRAVSGQAPDDDAPSGDRENVRVALHVRPLIDKELREGSAPCLAVTPGASQVTLGSHAFTYDAVYAPPPSGRPSEALFPDLVAPLVRGLFSGVNAAVLAYGQTGSGKTHTMGTSAARRAARAGIVPAATDALLALAREERERGSTVRIWTTYVEIHREEVRDLLAGCNGSGAGSSVLGAAGGGGGSGGDDGSLSVGEERGGSAASLRPGSASSAPTGGVVLRDAPGGGVVLAGATAIPVDSPAALEAALEAGALLRATASTGMNKESSRSHAICTLDLEIERDEDADPAPGAGPEGSAPGGDGDADAAVAAAGGPTSPGARADGAAAPPAPRGRARLRARLHLVDLAGSERAGRTQASGARLAEGIDINRGLLALGNVISALCSRKGHVPYRDSKLTRLLADALGGNARTLVVACVSPADTNAEETLCTLRYAGRARSIRNAPVANREVGGGLGPAEAAALTAQLASLRAQLSEARAELAAERAEPGRGARRGARPGSPARRSPTPPLDGRLVRELERLRAALAAALDEGEAGDEGEEDGSAGAGGGAGREAPGTATQPGDPDALAAEVKRLGAELRAQRRSIRVARALLKGDADLGLVLSPGLARAAGSGWGTAREHEGDGTPGGRDPPDESPGVDAEGGGGARPGGEGDGEAEARDPTGFDELTAEADELAAEVQRVDAQLRERQAAASAADRSEALREAWRRALRELAAERDGLAAERAELAGRLVAAAQAGKEERARLERACAARAAELEERARKLRQEERRVRELERARAAAEDKARLARADVLRLKTAKASLQRMAEQAARDAQAARVERAREVAQLRRKGDQAAAKLARADELAARQAAVLRRKTEEAEAARKRLKDLSLAGRRAARGGPGGAAAGAAGVAPGPEGPDAAGAEAAAGALALEAPLEVQPNPLAPLLRDDRARREWAERELEAVEAGDPAAQARERAAAAKARASRRLRALERRAAAGRCPGWWVGGDGGDGAAAGDGDAEGAARDLAASRRAAAREVELAGERAELSAAEAARSRAADAERGRGAGDPSRWAGLRSAADARALLRAVFQVAGEHRARARESERRARDAAEEAESLRLRLELAEVERVEAEVAAERDRATERSLRRQGSPGGKGDAPVAGSPGLAAGDGARGRRSSVPRRGGPAPTDPRPSTPGGLAVGGGDGEVELLAGGATDGDGEVDLPVGDDAGDDAIGGPTEGSTDDAAGSDAPSAPSYESESGSEGEEESSDPLSSPSSSDASGEEEGDSWDPSLATPAPARRGARRGVARAGRESARERATRRGGGGAAARHVEPAAPPGAAGVPGAADGSADGSEPAPSEDPAASTPPMRGWSDPAVQARRGGGGAIPGDEGNPVDGWVPGDVCGRFVATPPRGSGIDPVTRPKRSRSTPVVPGTSPMSWAAGLASPPGTDEEGVTPRPVDETKLLTRVNELLAAEGHAPLPRLTVGSLSAILTTRWPGWQRRGRGRPALLADAATLVGLQAEGAATGGSASDEARRSRTEPGTHAAPGSPEVHRVTPAPADADTDAAPPLPPRDAGTGRAPGAAGSPARARVGRAEAPLPPLRLGERRDDGDPPSVALPAATPSPSPVVHVVNPAPLWGSLGEDRCLSANWKGGSENAPPPSRDAEAGPSAALSAGPSASHLAVPSAALSADPPAAPQATPPGALGGLSAVPYAAPGAAAVADADAADAVTHLVPNPSNLQHTADPFRHGVASLSGGTRPSAAAAALERALRRQQRTTGAGAPEAAQATDAAAAAGSRGGRVCFPPAALYLEQSAAAIARAETLKEAIRSGMAAHRAAAREGGAGAGAAPPPPTAPRDGGAVEAGRPAPAWDGGEGDPARDLPSGASGRGRADLRVDIGGEGGDSSAAAGRSPLATLNSDRPSARGPSPRGPSPRKRAPIAGGTEAKLTSRPGSARSSPPRRRAWV